MQIVLLSWYYHGQICTRLHWRGWNDATEDLTLESAHVEGFKKKNLFWSIIALTLLLQESLSWHRLKDKTWFSRHLSKKFCAISYNLLFMSLHVNINIPFSQSLMLYNGLNYFIHYFSHIAAKCEYVWRLKTHRTSCN